MSSMTEDTGPLDLTALIESQKKELWEHKKKDHDKRHEELRSNLRAVIPLEISQALKNSIETQTTLDLW